MRPWALLTPIVVLVIALPLLRPLRHPDPRMMSSDEQARLATIESIGVHGTLAIDGASIQPDGSTVVRNDHLYADQPPMLAVLLSGSYWFMDRMGLGLRAAPAHTAYILTLLGATLPVALAAGLVYRMGRLFELSRPWRAGLALASVLATGFISYATVLNPHAPAAAAILCAAACLIHLSITRKRLHGSVWLATSGACAALAATIDPPTVIFLLLLVPVVLSFRWPVLHRLGGMVAYAIGAAIPLLVHVALVMSAGGNPVEWLNAGLDRLTAAEVGALATTDGVIAVAPDPLEDVDGVEQPTTSWQAASAVLARVWDALVGPHGLLSHFPVILVGLIGVGMIMHRHWPTSTKLLASATVGGALLIMLAWAVGDTDWGDPMFAARWFVVFLPLTLFWAGAWLRRNHRVSTWVAVTVLLLFSTFVSLVGATGPYPHGGFRSPGGSQVYTVAGALQNLIDPPQYQPNEPVLAGGE